MRSYFHHQICIGFRFKWLVLLTSVALLAMMARPAIIFADGPDNEPQRSLISTNASCVTVGDNTTSTSATLLLEWKGEVETASLLLAVAGTTTPHEIYLNGQPIGATAIRPAEQACQNDGNFNHRLYTDKLEIEPNLLKQGENRLTITNETNATNNWTLLNAYLTVSGNISGPSPLALKANEQADLARQMTRLGNYEFGTETLTSSYDGVGQNFIEYYAPTDLTNVPLVIAIHGMGAAPSSITSILTATIESRGWAFAAPDMHGRATVNSGSTALGWVGAQHDIIDTIAFMQNRYSIDSNRIYIVGESMGGQTATIMTSKYPDIFAASAEWLGITHLPNWYSELEARENQGVLGLGFWSLFEDLQTETGGTPQTARFEYERRSPLLMAENMQRIPLKIWHDREDLVVPVTHTLNLANKINALQPGQVETVILSEIESENCGQGTGSPDSYPPSPFVEPYGHCYRPDPVPGRYLTPTLVLDFLEPFTRNMTAPNPLMVRTDESKSYYWLKVEQSGGDHWTEATVAYNLAAQTVSATISDTNPLTVGLNLGSIPLVGLLDIPQAGLGFSAQTYLVKESGQDGYLTDYASGYLTIPLASSGQFGLTISPIDVSVAVSATARLINQASTNPITVTAKDQFGNPVPDGTAVTLTTTSGTFSSGSPTLNAVTTNGQVNDLLTFVPSDGSAQINATVLDKNGSATVDTVDAQATLAISATPSPVFGGESFDYTYFVENTGGITLTNIQITDDNGTPAMTADDIDVACATTLAPSASDTCIRTATLNQDKVNQVTMRANIDSHALMFEASRALSVTVYNTTVTANPAIVSTAELTTTLSVQVADSQNATPPNGTPVQFASSAGNVVGDSTLTDGLATATLSLTPSQKLTAITVTVANLVSASTLVELINPQLALTLVPSQTVVISGETVIYTYFITNTGDVPITDIEVVDNMGIQGQSVPICQPPVPLTPLQGFSCTRTRVLTTTVANIATVRGKDPRGVFIVYSDDAYVRVKDPITYIYVPLIQK